MTPFPKIGHKFSYCGGEKQYPKTPFSGCPCLDGDLCLRGDTDWGVGAGGQCRLGGAVALDAREERCYHFAVRVHLRQLEALDLATGRARNFFHENHTTVEGLVAGQPLARKVVDLFGRQATHCRVARAHDEGAGHLAGTVVPDNARHCGVADSGVLDQNSFDFGRGDLPSWENRQQLIVQVGIGEMRSSHVLTLVL